MIEARRNFVSRRNNVSPPPYFRCDLQINWLNNRAYIFSMPIAANNHAKHFQIARTKGITFHIQVSITS